MSIRTFAFAVALVLGIGCSTTQTQSSQDHTGAMWTERSASSGSRHEATSAQQAPAQGMQDTTTAAADTKEGQSGTGSSGAPAGTGSGSAGSSDSTGSSQQGRDQAGADRGQGAPGPGSAGMGWSGMGSSDATGTGGPEGATHSDTAGSEASGSAGAPGASDVTAHADDQTVTGTVSKFAKRSISIKSEQGEAKTLKIVPQTVVAMNGKTVKPSQLKQGQQVRASYNEQDGQDVAVTIEVSGRAAAPGSGGHVKGHHGDAPSGSGTTGSGTRRY
jgi:hypothetical protein